MPTRKTSDKQWVRKHTAAHLKQLTKCERMEADLARYVAKAQAEIDAERDVESKLLRDRDAAETNFERAWGFEAWSALVGSVRRFSPKC